jgi:hypothetical protein
MKACPFCGRAVPDDAAVCPADDCGKALAGTSEEAYPASPGASEDAYSASPGASETLTLRGPGAEIRRPPPPPRRVTVAADSRPRIHPSKRRQLVLVASATLVIVVAVICWARYYASAEPDPSLGDAVAIGEVVNPEGPPPDGKSFQVGQPEKEDLKTSDLNARDDPLPLVTKPKEAAIVSAAHPTANAASDPKDADPGEAITASAPPDLPMTKPADSKDDEPAEGAAAKERGGFPTAKPAEARRGNSRNAAAVANLYALRTEKRTDSFVRQLGGTPESEKAVAAGLDWLARHQAKDGHWGPDCLGGHPGTCCQGRQPCSEGGRSYPMAHSGLALLAFQVGGHYEFNGNKYSAVVRRGLDWLVQHQGPHGEFYLCPPGSPRGKPTQTGANEYDYFDRTAMFQHGIATFALTEACAVSRAVGRKANPRYMTSAKAALAFIEHQQQPDGGWAYGFNERPNFWASETAVSGWQVLALATARQAGIKVTNRTISRAEQYFQRLENPSEGTAGYGSRGHPRNTMTAVAMLVHQLLLGEPETVLVERAAPRLARDAGNWRPSSPSGAMLAAQTDYYEWYHCALAMHQAGGEPWSQWNMIVRDKVVSFQEKSGCARGSWPAGSDTWGSTCAGRIYTTALAVMTLEAPYSYAREEREPYPSSGSQMSHQSPDAAGRRRVSVSLAHRFPGCYTVQRKGNKWEGTRA